MNPVYDGVFSFVNDYAALMPDEPGPVESLSSPLLVVQPLRVLKVVAMSGHLSPIA